MIMEFEITVQKESLIKYLISIGYSEEHAKELCELGATDKTKNSKEEN